MGVNHYKITYECDCGCDYGSCERRNFFLLEMSRSIDIYTLYHKHHADEPNAKLDMILQCGDNGIEALTKLLNSSDSSEKYDDCDHEEIKQIRGY